MEEGHGPILIPLARKVRVHRTDRASQGKVRRYPQEELYEGWTTTSYMGYVKNTALAQTCLSETPQYSQDRGAQHCITVVLR